MNEGITFSLGEKQLICVCRILLRPSKIILLDEATASIDYETDKLVQELLYTEFPNCTLIIIAHRIQTIRKCDKVAVIGEGKLIEYDSPETLIKMGGEFAYYYLYLYICIENYGKKVLLF